MNNSKKQYIELFDENAKCPKCHYEFTARLLLESKEQKKCKIKCKRCLYEFEIEIAEELIKENLGRIKREEKQSFKGKQSMIHEPLIHPIASTIILLLCLLVVFNFHFLIVILLFLGFCSFILVHELSHLISIKIFQKLEKNVLLIKNKPLWKQPTGIILLSGLLGEIIYLSFFIPFLYYVFLSVGKMHPFGLGAVFGTSIHLFTAYPSQMKGKVGDIYRYKIYSKLIKKGCECGSKEFITGREDTKCVCCNKRLIHFELPKHAITPQHLNPNYLLSKKKNEIETSIQINANVEDVYKHLIGDPPSNFQKKFKMRDYTRLSDKKASWRQWGILVTEYIVERKEPEYIKIHIEYGTNYEDWSYVLKRVDGGTILQHHTKFLYKMPERIIRKRMNKTLKYIKEEIEHAYH